MTDYIRILSQPL